MPWWVVWALGAWFFWGTWGLLYDQAVKALGRGIAMPIAGLSTAFFFFVMAWIFWKDWAPTAEQNQPWQWLWAAATGLVTGAASLCFVIALRTAPGPLPVIGLTAAYPIASVVLAAIFLKGSFTPMQALGVIISAIGVGILVANSK